VTDPSNPAHLWELLTDDERAELTAAGRTHEHPAGTVLLREGEPSRSALVLLVGRVKVVATGAGGSQTLLAFRVAGDIVGELAAIDGMPRSATVIAVESVTVLRIPAPDFNRILAGHAGIAHAVLKVVSSRLRLANLRRVEYGDTTVAQRLAGVLRRLAVDHGTVHAQRPAVTLPYSQEELARMVAGSREQVARALRTMRVDGVISTGRKRITIERPEVLSRYGAD
jgi:CRP/FNR family transcriptional regulator, cyclic AMP receptor protein